ncbi:MAG: hypothetical protein M3Y09_00335 [Actinomycetota bacterium]|nr:hypothetical protein [Actinomycetota bacterium]
MLRLLLAWRLLRMLFPLLLFGFAALALTPAFRAAPRATGRGQPSVAHLAQGVERTASPLVPDARHILLHELTAPRP